MATADQSAGAAHDASPARTVEDSRKFILRVLGDNECWVNCKEYAFGAPADRVFSRRNFDFFYYDPAHMVMFVRPTMEMHGTTVDDFESLPNSHYTKMLLEKGTGDVIDIYSDSPLDDDEGDISSSCSSSNVAKTVRYKWHVETVDELTPERYLEEFPGSISLLPTDD